MVAPEVLEKIFQDGKAFWTEKAKVHGAITVPSTNFENVQYNTDVVADLFRGFPKERLSKATVLDFGCGEGSFIPYMAPKVKRYIGIDTSKSCIAYAKKTAAPFSNAYVYELLHHDSLDDDICEAGSLADIDLFCSWTVFQHVPHKLTSFLLKYIGQRMHGGSYFHAQMDWPPFGNPKPRSMFARFDQLSDNDFWECRWWPDWMLWKMFEESGFEIYELPSEKFLSWRMVRREA